MNPRQANTALVLSTLAFAISFAVWGMLAPMAKTFQTELSLTEGQVWLLIAIPVILGSVLRLPMGMLADRFGGRIVFGLLLLLIAVPAWMLSFSSSYAALLLGGLLLGMAGTSFSIGVALVSKWFPPQKQGLVLGIYGLGTGGQSIALLAVPLLANQFGWQTTYRIFGAVALMVGIVFLLFARNAPAAGQPKGLGEMLRVLYQQPLCWVLGLFYFLTFGGFVALGIGLPKLLQEVFHLTREDAGMRVAFFALLATALRPVGGWLSDRIGGARVLLGEGVAALISAAEPVPSLLPHAPASEEAPPASPRCGPRSRCPRAGETHGVRCRSRLRVRRRSHPWRGGLGDRSRLHTGERRNGRSGSAEQQSGGRDRQLSSARSNPSRRVKGRLPGGHRGFHGFRLPGPAGGASGKKPGGNGEIPCDMSGGSGRHER